MSRWLGLVTAIAVAAGGIWYVSAPPKTVDGYRERAALTAETLRSQVESAQLWSDAVIAGKATHGATLVAFEDVEQAAAAASSDFETYEPPRGTVALRSELSSIASDASDALASLRIAAQQDDWHKIEKTTEPLPKLTARLDRLQEEARR